METDNLFLLMVGLVLTTLIVTSGAYNYYESGLIAEGIAAGGDPQEISCAYDLATYCDVVAAKETKSNYTN